MARWILTIVAAVVTLAYASTAWVSLNWVRPSDHLTERWATIGGGAVTLTWQDATDYLFLGEYDPETLHAPTQRIEHHYCPSSLSWRPHRWNGPTPTSKTCLLHIPLWPMSLFLSVAALTSWVKHRRAVRRTHSNNCLSCGYDRAGHPSAAARCPECGAIP